MSGPEPVVIAAEGLTKVYKLDEQEVAALRGVSLTVERNEFVAIMGPSGSGKSTLMNLIGCLDTPTSGEYRLNGRLVSAMSEDELAYIRNREIGFVFQVFNLLARATAFHNVELPLVYRGVPRRARRERALAALDLVGLTPRRDHFPAQLSGGEQQRIAIARAIAKRPSVLLCDEPTGALDSATGVKVLEALERINAETGTTTVVITHNADIASMAHRVLSMADGRIVREQVNATRKRAADLRW